MSRAKGPVRRYGHARIDQSGACPGSAEPGHADGVRQISLPIATAVAAMRQEKPHSLSYQDITRTSVPSITLVWSMWKIELCGSWLKSLETFGSLVEPRMPLS